MSETMTADATEVLDPADAGDGWTWSVVEIFGHRRHVGKIREEERFGTKMLRIDIPKQGDPAVHGWSSFFYGGGSIFSITPTDEESALRANRPYSRPSATPLPAPAPEDHDWADDEEGDDAE